MWEIFLVSFLIAVGAAFLVCSEAPSYGVFGVLSQAVGYLFLLSFFGCPFLGLLLLLVYVGGMLIVFLFSSLLSAESYPKMSRMEVIVFSLALVGLCAPFTGSWQSGQSVSLTLLPLGAESSLEILFSVAGLLTCAMGLALFVSLIVVLMVSFEHTKSALRPL
uniref:NADH-ubiquinone oxidoreductase chain 6 n=1 Tax=Ophiomusa kimblae TaxID=3135533 RepID=A0AAU6PWX0_9ECHI